MENERLLQVSKNLENKYNCAQAVACAYAPLFGLNDEQLIFKVMEGFGGGMGIKHTCGAVTAMAFIAGLANSDGNLENPESKKDTYEIIRKMTAEFIEKNQSIICNDIKGLETGIVLRTCEGCMLDAGELIEKYIIGENNEY